MKRFSTLAFFLPVVLFVGCSKDVLKRYDKRIVGSWRIADVDRFGIGGDRDNLLLQMDTFIFRDDGSSRTLMRRNNSYEATGIS